MTDSIKTTLCLTKIPAIDRLNVPAKLCTVSSPHGEIVERYVKPSHQRSPLTGTKTKWITRCSADEQHPELGQVPYQIEAELNIPNALTGHNVEHGTSVYAAGVAALEIQRIWMADAGLGRDVLDLLTTADISLRGVTITYLVRCACEAAVRKMVEDMCYAGKKINGKFHIEESTNMSLKLTFATYAIKIYWKTDLAHCKFPRDAPNEALIAAMQCLVRIEVVLAAEYLTNGKLATKLQRNLTVLENWRDAYDIGLYEMIYAETVLKRLELGDRPLRHKAPREEVFALLSETERQFLRWYLDGNPAREFSSVVASPTPTKRYSELSLPIYKVARINTDIPWVEHTKLACYELAPKLHYPGDHSPSDEHTPWCFCEANWPALRLKLKTRYEAALALHAAVAEPAPQVDDDYPGVRDGYKEAA